MVYSDASFSGNLRTVVTRPPRSISEGGGRISVVDRRDGYQGGGRLEINDTIGIVQGGIMLR